jgi:hypothetical protein
MTRRALINEGRTLARYYLSRYSIRRLTGDVDLVTHLVDDAIDLWGEVTGWAGPEGLWN